MGASPQANYARLPFNAGSWSGKCFNDWRNGLPTKVSGNIITMGTNFRNWTEAGAPGVLAYPAELKIERSRLDGRPAWIIDYTNSPDFFGRSFADFVDEMREVGPHACVLGCAVHAFLQPSIEHDHDREPKGLASNQIVRCFKPKALGVGRTKGCGLAHVTTLQRSGRTKWSSALANPPTRCNLQRSKVSRHLPQAAPGLIIGKVYIRANSMRNALPIDVPAFHFLLAQVREIAGNGICRRFWLLYLRRGEIMWYFSVQHLLALT